ncbi:hypothetical protein [Paenibacillus harenae]|uniref:hypothetical protein n=1 Tax=Paenibacillus harenae TaxID=306543 RepID=UPI00278CF591|nr:hypothetical protein [Paenibacillus harenae]MDQ0060180.1 YhcN/YlaJ family sporulation lipoprotein [Paenibacillus harenae]
MVKRIAALLVSAAVLFAVAIGCNYENQAQKSDTDYGSRETGDPKTIGNKAFGTMSTNPNQHMNAFFEYSSKISNQISSINGIASGLVFLTDKNAYVGLLLDWTSVGTRNSGGTLEQDNTGTTEGVYNHATGSNFTNNQRLAGPYNSYFTVNDYNNLSDELKQTIALKVRKMAPTVQEVHISANMELVNHFNEYAKIAWGGRSLMPSLDEFNNLVKYHFAGGTTMPKTISDPIVIPHRQERNRGQK